MRRLLCVLPLLLSLTSCVQRTLCYGDDDDYGYYRLNMAFSYDLIWHEDYSAYDTLEWVDLGWRDDSLSEEMDLMARAATPLVPEGIRVLVIRDGEYLQLSNVGPFSGALTLAEGNYALLCYNNDVETIIIDGDYGSADVATASTRTRVRSTYMGNPMIQTSRSEETVTEPDMLYYSYIPSYAVALITDGDTVDVAMKPLVYTYLIDFRFAHGFEHVALARGTLEGMAASVNLSDGTTSDESATILYDCTLGDTCVTASVKTFGIPDYRLNEGAQNRILLRRVATGLFGITLEVRLRNGVYETFYFDVTDQVIKQPNGGIITVGDIEIDDEDAKTSTGSAFDVTVDDWGENEDIVLPL